MRLSINNLSDGMQSILPMLVKGLREDLAYLIKEGVHKDIITLEHSDKIQMYNTPANNCVTIDFGLKLAFKDIAKISQLQEENARLQAELQTYKDELRARLTQVLED